MNCLLCDVCKHHLILNPRPIGGLGIKIQIDKTLVAKQKFNKGRLVKERWLFGGVCPEQRCGFVQFVPDRSRAILDPIIMKIIAPGSNIKSNSWSTFLKRPYQGTSSQLNICSHKF